MKKYDSNRVFKVILSLITLLFFNNSVVFSQDKTINEKSNTDKLELETLKIQGNKELPKVLFVVPWQNKTQKKGSKNEHRLILHSLYGDLFEPITPIGNQTSSH